MYYTAFISKKDKSKMLQFPIPLEDLPAVKSGQNTESFTDFFGVEYTFITGSKPLEFSIKTWIPKEGTKYPFQLVKNPNKSDYTAVLNWALDKKEPIYLIVANSTGLTIIQGLFSIDFEESKNQFGDTTLSIDCKQWRDHNS
ncbi:hypothetical protein ACN077_20725 [Clostridium chromiireducens]|uniref:hypothetical protein n=1 Tax=Clostridium chromiireducens TaxID=225345 RepID=UPI003AF62FB1